MAKFSVGDRVRTVLRGEDEDEGRIIQFGGKHPDSGRMLPDDVAFVAWDSGVWTPIHTEDIEHE